MSIYELNNIHKDSEVVNPKLTKTSPVVEVFSAMVKGESLDRFGKKADVAVKYIETLGERAMNGDGLAISELNTIRRFVIEAPVMQEMKLLGIFGSYQAVGFDDSIEREVTTYAGERSREQALGGDVVFPIISVDRYPVPTFTVSGGYEVDYRRVSLGDMSKENEGMAQVRTDILNRAKLAIVKKIYNAIKAATKVQHYFEYAGLTKQGIDALLVQMRRYGKPSVIGDYAILSQFTPWAGYVGASSVLGISDDIINEIHRNGLLGNYNGASLVEIENPYDEYKPLTTWTPDSGSHNYGAFQPLMPAGLAFIVPSGTQSPIATWTRGGLTTLSGNDVKTGKLVTRFDIEVACDIAKGQEHKIGAIYDTNVGGL